MNWFNQLAHVWNCGDAHAVAPLFSVNAIYSENPFAPPLHGRAAIIAYWQTELANHRDVDCVIEPLHQGADWAVAHWHTTLTHADTGKSVAFDGVMIVQFNAAGECTNLREWWHNAENTAQRT